MTFTTHYDMLRVARDAPQEVIQAAFRALAQKYHPDKNTSHAEADQLMQSLNIAYKSLADPEKKTQHDEWIRQHEHMPEKTSPAGEEKSQDKGGKADHAAWVAWAEKTATEARTAREQAVKAQEKAQTASASQKPALDAAAKQAGQLAEEAEKKAAKAAEKLSKAAIEKPLAAVPAQTVARDGKPISTHYDVLKVSRQAPIEVIRAAYKVLAQKYQDAEHSTSPQAVAMIQMLNGAYKTLSDDAHRAEHDLWIASQSPERRSGSRGPMPDERKAQEKADKAEAEAKALAALSVAADEQAAEADRKAAKAEQDRAANKKPEKVEAWNNWAAKTALEAKEARARATKAAALAQEGKAKAVQAQAELKVEKERSASTIEAARKNAEREKALWAEADAAARKNSEDT